MISYYSMITNKALKLQSKAYVISRKLCILLALWFGASLSEPRIPEDHTATSLYLCIYLSMYVALSRPRVHYNVTRMLDTNHWTSSTCKQWSSRCILYQRDLGTGIGSELWQDELWLWSIILGNKASTGWVVSSHNYMYMYAASSSCLDQCINILKHYWIRTFGLCVNGNEQCHTM